MMDIEILSLASDGTLKLPERMREKLYLMDVDSMVVVADRDSMILKPIRSPSSPYFDRDTEEPEYVSAYSEEDAEEIVNQVVKEVRREKRA